MNGSTIDIEYRHFHLFCGLGGGAKGFNKGNARVGQLRARFRCIGGIDVDRASVRDFSRAASVEGTVMDLFDEAQYRAFHGKAPPEGWVPAMPDDIRRAAGGERPHIVFLSAPCEGFSGLLPEQSSKTAKYQALNGLTLRGVWLTLEAWKDDPPELIVFENVPRIMTRGRHLLDQIVALLRAYGYAVAETTHDCGEIGGLGQSQKRFLLVARHEQKVPPFLYEPEKRRLRGGGEILETLPMPGDASGGPMHRMPALQWKTWVRLAFVEAGADWRSLNKLAIENGTLRDFGILPEAVPHNGAYGVRRWNETAGVVTSNGRPASGMFSVADSRIASGGNEYSQYGVRRWSDPMGAVINVKSPGQGTFAVADPTIPGKPRFNNVFRIVPWSAPSPAVAGPGGPAGGLAVADPRPSQREDHKQTKYRVTGMDEPAGTVIAASTTGNGAFAVADPRPTHGPNAHQNKHSVARWEAASKSVTGSDRVGSGALSVADPRPAAFGEKRANYQTGGHYGVVSWQEPAYSVPGFAKHDRGHWSVADPREADPEPLADLPAPDERLVAVIRALDGTWHRPFTTFELAALQSLVDPDEIAADFALDGKSDSAWRERIGNSPRCCPIGAGRPSPTSAATPVGHMSPAGGARRSGTLTAVSRSAPSRIRPSGASSSPCRRPSVTGTASTGRSNRCPSSPFPTQPRQRLTGCPASRRPGCLPARWASIGSSGAMWPHGASTGAGGAIAGRYAGMPPASSFSASTRAPATGRFLRHSGCPTPSAAGSTSSAAPCIGEASTRARRISAGLLFAWGAGSSPICGDGSASTSVNARPSRRRGRPRTGTSRSTPSCMSSPTKASRSTSSGSLGTAPASWHGWRRA